MSGVWTTLLLSVGLLHITVSGLQAGVRSAVKTTNSSRSYCQQSASSCDTHGQCCSGCCKPDVGSCSASKSECEEKESPACAAVTCPVSSDCVVGESGQAECVPVRDQLPPLQDPCALMLCAADHVCVTVPESKPPRGTCLLSYVANPCMTVKCARGSNCQLKEGVFPPRAECVSTSKDVCESFFCPPESKCVPRVVLCVRAPCPPLPQCVPTTPCATVKCAAGYTCQEVDVQCFRAPCPSQPQCVPNTPCAAVKCAAGHTCQEVQVQCITTPCLPVGECVLTNPCSTNPGPCAPTAMCREVDVLCKRAPCPRKAICIPSKG